MEPKKNPKFDVHRKRGVLLNVGLIVSLLLVIIAIKWTAPVKHPPIPLHKDLEPEAMIIDNPRSTDFKKKEPIRPKRIASTLPVPSQIVEMMQPNQENEPTNEVPFDIDDPTLSVGVNDIPPEPVEPDTFILVQQMPKPVGGWETFYKILKKNIKYPKRAERVGATGKVYVEFTVNNKGELTNFKIIKGIGYGCDEEAARVIALTKWTVGKQRGRPVNVKMVQPISFNLSN